MIKSDVSLINTVFWLPSLRHCKACKMFIKTSQDRKHVDITFIVIYHDFHCKYTYASFQKINISSLFGMKGYFCSAHVFTAGMNSKNSRCMMIYTDRCYVRGWKAHVRTVSVQNSIDVPCNPFVVMSVFRIV